MDYNEILFWKVYRNVYLNKLIYDQLLYSEIDYNDYRDYSINKNRIKHKDIKSLKWMIQNKQFELLKYKLESNQYISIDKTSILSLIKLTPSSNDIKIQSDVFKNKEMYLEIFHLLMKRSDHFQDDPKLIETSIIYKKPIILEIVLNKPYNLKISKLNLYYAIRLKNQTILNILLKHIDTNILIKCVNKYQKYCKPENFKFKSSFIQFVLNNSEIYQIPPTPLILSTTTITTTSTITTETNNENSLIENYHLKFQLLELKEIIGVESFEMKNKLLDIDYFINSYNIQQFNTCIQYIKNRKYTDKITIQQLLLYFRIYYKCISKIASTTNDIPIAIHVQINEIINTNQCQQPPIQQFNENNEKIKQLFKLLVIESKSMKLYSVYFFKYYETINATGLYSNGFKNSFSNGILLKLDKLVKSNHSCGDHGKNQIIKFISTLINNNDSAIEFRLHPILINKIRDIIITCMDSDKWYQKTLKSIINKDKIKEFGLPGKWNLQLESIMVEPIKSFKKLKINSKYEINLLIGANNITRQYFINKINNELVEFKNKQLIGDTIMLLKNSAPNKLLKLYYPLMGSGCYIKLVKWSQILYNPLKDSLFNDFGLSCYNDTIEWYNHNNKPLNLKIVSNTDKIYYEFKPKLIKAFIWQIVQKNEYSKLLNIKFNLDEEFISKYTGQLIKILYRSIINCDINTTTLLLYNTTFKLNLFHIKKIWNEQLLFVGQTYIYPKNNLNYTPAYKDINQQQVLINYIKFWINYIAINSCGSNSIRSVYELIINFLFSNLLRMIGNRIKLVKDIKNLIDTNIKNITQINHSLANSIYYLNIKSPKIMRLIKDIYKEIPQDGSRKDFCELVKKLIDPDKFTFEYIFGDIGGGGGGGVDVDDLLKIFINQSVNFTPTKTLVCLLKINKIDLFIALTQDIIKSKKVLNIACSELIHDICVSFSSLITSSTTTITTYQANINNFQTIINLFKQISNDPNYHLIFFKTAFLYNCKEVVSYLIEQYDINELSTSYTRPYLWIDDYPIIEHICKNHPNVELKSLIFPNKSTEIFQLLLTERS